MTEQHKPRFCGECGATVVSDSKFCSDCGAGLARSEAATSVTAPDETTPDGGDRSRQARPNDGLVLASSAERFVACLLDWLYWVVASFLLYQFVFAQLYAWGNRDANAGPSGDFSGLIFPVLVVLAIISVFVWGECHSGSKGSGSLGKRTLGLRVQPWPNAHDVDPSHVLRFLTRAFILAIPIVNLVCLVMMALDRNHRAWYDKIAGTVVVKVR